MLRLISLRILYQRLICSIGSALCDGHITKEATRLTEIFLTVVLIKAHKKVTAAISSDVFDLILFQGFIETLCCAQ